MKLKILDHYDEDQDMLVSVREGTNEIGGIWIRDRKSNYETIYMVKGYNFSDNHLKWYNFVQV